MIYHNIHLHGDIRTKIIPKFSLLHPNEVDAEFPTGRMIKIFYSFLGHGTNSCPIDPNTNILENTTPFLHIAATLVYRSFELVNSKFKQAKKNNILCCILDSRVNSYPTTVCGTAFS